MEISQLRIYSIAIVAANKVLSSSEIEATPVEDTPMLNGELSDAYTDYRTSAKDAEGAAYEHSIATATTIKAKWLPISSSNRMTAPDVRRGETVVLWRFADTDQFYWSTLKDDMHLRKLETVVYAFSATRDEASKTTAETSYFLEVSTHKKLVHLHTCREDGEPFAYDIQLNTAEGFFTIQDDDGNSIQLDSANQRILMFNKLGSFLDINKTKIFLKSTDLVDIKTKAVNIQSETYTQKATTNTIEVTTENFKAQTNNMTAMTTHVGNFALMGGLAASPGASGSGVAIEGAVEVVGTIRSDGTIVSLSDVLAGAISLTGHHHQGVHGGTSPALA